MREKNICLKGLGTVVQIAKPSSRFPTTAGCFFVLHLLVNSVIVMVIAKMAGERVFTLIQFSHT